MSPVTAPTADQYIGKPCDYDSLFLSPLSKDDQVEHDVIMGCSMLYYE